MFSAVDWKVIPHTKVNHDFKRLAQEEKRVYVLHHPHTAVKGRTWLRACAGLTKILPSVKQYAEAERYYESDQVHSKWDTLDKVLKLASNTSTIDFIIGNDRKKQYRSSLNST